MTAAYLFLVLIGSLWAFLGAMMVVRTLRRRPSLDAALPPVSVLKPLCGTENQLEENLRSFFEQDYPEFELVFGVEGENDGAADVVRRLRREYPGVTCRLVVHDGGRGVNPKVSNLRAMISLATHDMVAVSDSNVHAPPHYLRNLATSMDDDVGLATNLFAGAGEKSLGSVLSSLHLAGEVVGSVAAASQAFKHPIVVGKSMMFRYSELESLGGFESVKDVLAEDYVIGRMFHMAGRKIAFSPDALRNVSENASVGDFFRRQLRWGMIRLRLNPITFALEPLLKPLVVAAAAPLFGVPIVPMLLWAILVTVVRDALQWTALRGPKGLMRALPLAPLRDVIALAAWAAAPFVRNVRWRGTKVRVSAGTRLYASSAHEPGMVMIDASA